MNIALVDSESQLFKRCSKCNRDLPIDSFYKRKSSKIGYTSRCKSCLTEYKAEWLNDLKQQVVVINDGIMTCAKCNIEKQVSDFLVNRTRKCGRSTICGECARDYQRKWRKTPEVKARRNDRLKQQRHLDPEYRDRLNAYNKELARERRKDPEYMQKLRDGRKRRYDANPELKERDNERKRKQSKRDPKFRVCKNFSRVIGLSLNGDKGGRHWEDIVGFTREDLIKHLSKQFTEGMTWNNYGEWHIDHKIPRSAFNFTKTNDLDFRKCWALKNLQPLWARDNIVKSDNLDKPFQPCLALSI